MEVSEKGDQHNKWVKSTVINASEKIKAGIYYGMRAWIESTVWDKVARETPLRSWHFQKYWKRWGCELLTCERRGNSKRRALKQESVLECEEQEGGGVAREGWQGMRGDGDGGWSNRGPASEGPEIIKKKKTIRPSASALSVEEAMRHICAV